MEDYNDANGLNKCFIIAAKPGGIDRDSNSANTKSLEKEERFTALLKVAFPGEFGFVNDIYNEKYRIETEEKQREVDEKVSSVLEPLGLLKTDKE